MIVSDLKDPAIYHFRNHSMWIPFFKKTFFFLHQCRNIFRKKQKWNWTANFEFRNKNLKLQFEKSHRFHIWTIFLSNFGIRSETLSCKFQICRTRNCLIYVNKPIGLKIMFYTHENSMTEEIL